MATLTDGCKTAIVGKEDVTVIDNYGDAHGKGELGREVQGPGFLSRLLTAGQAACVC